jgi:hypothetical protein
MMRTRERWLWALLGVLWLAAIGAGARVLWSYQSTPGERAAERHLWPAASRLPRDPARPTLVLVAHPHCACTRASLAELAGLMQRLRGRVAGRVVFVRPAGMPAGWERTDTWRTAQGIPEVTVWADPGGVEAERFGARTSGQVLLYGRDGRLLFSGGITPIRGHIGDSAGQERIVSLVTTGRADAATSRVFGCALGTPRGREPQGKGV